MLGKINFVVIAVFLMLFIVIVNAAGEKNENSTNETSKLNNSDIEVNDIKDVDNTQSNIENSQKDKNSGKAVTASFGVYLEIVG